MRSRDKKCLLPRACFFHFQFFSRKKPWGCRKIKEGKLITINKIEGQNRYVFLLIENVASEERWFRFGFRWRKKRERPWFASPREKTE